MHVLRATSSVILAGATALSTTSLAHSAVIFVNAAQTLPTNQQTGASWTLAFSSLQSALSASHANDQIWVAPGTYKPTTTGDRLASFTLRTNVQLFGGLPVGAAS